MRKAIFLQFLIGILAGLSFFWVNNAEDPYRYYTWTVTYGTISPLGVAQQVSFLPKQKDSCCQILLALFSFLNLLFIKKVLTILQGILINGQFPGPPIEAVTNDNIIVNVINKLDEPFLITWLVATNSLLSFFQSGNTFSRICP